MTKTKQELADEALEKEVDESGRGFLERPYNRYRFHNGFIAGHESRDKEVEVLKRQLEVAREAMESGLFTTVHVYPIGMKMAHLEKNGME